ncbi:MAG: hypothetical protein K8U03_01160 [Planctomycetia bacterium]|nr:hypothetical protein [Planctomycetia bacterium]
MQVLKKGRFPASSVMIGIVVGGIVGTGLAQGVLSIVAWRREVRREAQEAADIIEADRQEKMRQRNRNNSDWQKWSTQPRKP